MELIQRKGRTKKIFSLTESGLVVSTTIKKKGLYSEETFPFENIKRDRFFYTHKSLIFLVWGCVFLIFYTFAVLSIIGMPRIFFIVNSIWAAGGITLILLYFFYRPKVYFLKTFEGKYIRFLMDKDYTAIQNFIEETIKKRNEYLRVKYGQPNPHLSYDAQYSNLNILQREGVLSMKEYKDKIALLNTMFNQSVPKQTFFTYSQN
jgi:hypothetical protein